MASFSTTELNASIDEKWDMDLEEARYAEATIMPLVSNKSAIVAKSGDIINVTVKAKYTVGDVGSNGAFVPQVYTPTSVAVTVNKHKQVAIEVEDKASFQSFWTPDSDFPKDAGAALAVQYDSDLAALYTDITTNVVGDSVSPGSFDKVKFLAAMLKLADTNIPKKDLNFVLPPIAFYGGIYNEVQLTSAEQLGKGSNALTTNERFPILGVPTHESTVLTKSGSVWKALLFHSSAFAIAMQKNNKYSRADRTAGLVFSYVVAVQSLYGVRTIRQDHACLINLSDA